MLEFRFEFPNPGLGGDAGLLFCAAGSGLFVLGRQVALCRRVPPERSCPSSQQLAIISWSR